MALGGFAALNTTYMDKLASRICVSVGMPKKGWPKQSPETLEAMIRFLVSSNLKLPWAKGSEVAGPHVQ